MLVARNAGDALEISAAGSIDVLLTDIVMPHTSGPQLVAKYLAERPAPIVIYMSGYADDALARYELDPTTVFLRKPFTPSVLARTIRDALDAAQGAHRRRETPVPTMRRTERMRRARLLIVGASSLACGGTRVARLRARCCCRAFSTARHGRRMRRPIFSPGTSVDPRGLGRLQMWGAYEPVRHWVLYAQGEGGRPATRATRARRTTSTATSSEFSIRQLKCSSSTPAD